MTSIHFDVRIRKSKRKSLLLRDFRYFSKVISNSNIAYNNYSFIQIKYFPGQRKTPLNDNLSLEYHNDRKHGLLSRAKLGLIVNIIRPLVCAIVRPWNAKKVYYAWKALVAFARLLLNYARFSLCIPIRIFNQMHHWLVGW